MTGMSQTRFAAGCVAGTGTMGPGIALTLALGGVRVALLSRSAEGAARGAGQARSLGRALADNGLRDSTEVQEAIERISACTDFEAAIPSADIVIETGPEDMGWKQEFFGRMDAAARPDAVLASNTSSLSISAVAARCARKERVLATHFWNPAHLIPLVEIVQGRLTAPDAVEAVRGLLAACGKSSVV